MQKIYNIIDEKIEAHKKEVELTFKEMNEKQEKIKKDLQNNQKNITEHQKLFILRDKLTFHKACILALDDLKTELKKESI